MQNLNTNEMTGRGVIVLNVSEMPQENISVGKGKNYLLVGDNSVWLKKIPNNSIDSIVTDPPAGISFMGRGWDSDKGGRDNWIAWMCEVATECKRVLKPGGHAFVWAIPRTSHWTATAWENAGFEIRDIVAHVFGSGFPKSLNIGKKVDELQGNERKVVGEKRTPDGKLMSARTPNSKDGYHPSHNVMSGATKHNIWQDKGNSEWEGWGTALKPAREDWILMRKPLEKGLTIAENVLKYGTGGLNIDESRVISYTTAYNDGDNNDCTLQEHTVLEIRHKICSEPPFSLSESLELSRLSSDDEYGQKWYKQRDYSDDCSSCRRLYDALLPLFLKGDQVSVQQLHDVLADIDRLRTEQKHNPSSQDSDLPSSLDDFYQLILSYLNDTTLILNRQEKITLNLNKKGEQLFNEGDVKKAKWSGDSEERTGRFPANLIHDGSEEVVGLFPNSSGGAFPKKHGSSGFVSPEERESRIEMKDSGSAARFFKECKPDILCYLCNCTIDDKHGKMSVINSNLCSKDAKTVERILSQDITTITSDSVVPFVLHDIQLKNEGKEAQSQSHARNVEKSSPVSQATTESIAQTNAEDLEEKQAVQNAKSAGNLCDLCATSIVQSIVAMKQGQDPALPLGLVSTSERKKQILTKCLASYVAALGNTDTILTTGSLSLFFGFVRDAIENTTSRERSEQKGSSEQSQQRLRYCSKASKKDRDEGLEGFEEKNNMRVNAPRESEEEKLSTMTKNFHPTVKPTALMRYLVKLVTPPGGTVLDPFTGSGSTGKACKLEGFEFIGIEREEEYVKIAEARIAAVTHQPTLV